MHDRVVERDRPIEVRPRLREVSHIQQGGTHQAIPEQTREGRTLLLRQRQELIRKRAHHVAVARDIVRKPEAVEDREQQ